MLDQENTGKYITFIFSGVIENAAFLHCYHCLYFLISSSIWIVHFCYIPSNFYFKFSIMCQRVTVLHTILLCILLYFVFLFCIIKQRIGFPVKLNCGLRQLNLFLRLNIFILMFNHVLSQRPQLVKGNMQLFSVDQQRSQALEAHAASFASFKVCFFLNCVFSQCVIAFFKVTL